MAKKRLIIMFILLAILVGFFNPVHVHAAEGEGFGYITLSNTRSSCAIYESPSTHSAARFYLKDGTGVSLLSYVANNEGYWYLIQYTNNKTGYVQTEWVDVRREIANNKPATNAEGQPTVGYITLSNTSSTCAIRKEPNSNSTVLFYLKHGTQIKRISTVANTEGYWYKIEYTKNKVGYVLSDRVSMKGATNKPSNDTQTNASAESQPTFGYITLSNTRDTCAILSEPHSRSTAVFYLKHGTLVKRISTVTNSEGTWYKIEYTKDKVGYVLSKQVSLKGTTSKPSKDTQTSTSVEGQSTFGFITLSNTRGSCAIRKEPSSRSVALFYLMHGTGVKHISTVTNSEGTWYKIEYTKDKVGYVLSERVSLKGSTNKPSKDTDTNASTETNKTWKEKEALVQVNTKLTMRSKPSTTSYEVLGYLYNGDCVTVVETTNNGKWKKVETQNGKVAWVSGAYVKEGKWVHVSTGKTTSYTSSANSRYNASLACSRLTSFVISPDSTFSWIKTMGSCSKEKGFKESTVFENGKRVKGYGGGVCQVSTTINIAAKNAGIKTNARKHSLPVSYAERKDEATVAYPMVDFSFKNTLKAPIKLVLSASNGSCTCKVYKFVFDN